MDNTNQGEQNMGEQGMKCFEVYEWISEDKPMPFQIKERLGIDSDSAWFIYTMHSHTSGCMLSPGDKTGPREFEKHYEKCMALIDK